MEDLKRIVWLASYPKSGNTWCRAFLTYLLRKEEEMDINDLIGGPIASNRETFDEVTGLSSSDLTKEEIENLRPDVYIYLAKNSKETLYKKIHDAYITTASGRPLVPAEVTKAVVYIIRNPLDIVASFANHLNASLDATIKVMDNKDYAFCAKDHKLHNQLEQKLLTWNQHVTSWVDYSHLPIMTVRYEDIITSPLITFTKITRFLGLRNTESEIQKAMELSTFNKLKQQEEEKGFKEKAPDSGSFFRKGIKGSWMEELNQKQVKKVIEQHKDIMERFGYYPL